MKFKVLLVSVFFIFILLPGINLAQNKVVVIPLISDAPPPVLPPCAQSYTNSIGMTFNLLPAGTFTMGSPATEPGGPYDDETEHQVTLSRSFYMQTTEVTNGHWDAVITDESRGINPSESHTGDNYPVKSLTGMRPLPLPTGFLSMKVGLPATMDREPAQVRWAMILPAQRSLLSPVALDTVCRPKPSGSMPRGPRPPRPGLIFIAMILPPIRDR